MCYFTQVGQYYVSNINHILYTNDVTIDYEVLQDQLETNETLCKINREKTTTTSVDYVHDDSSNKDSNTSNKSKKTSGIQTFQIASTATMTIENYFIFFCSQGNIKKGSKKAREAWSLECSQQNDSNILPFLTTAANEIESIPYKQQTQLL